MSRPLSWYGGQAAERCPSPSVEGRVVMRHVDLASCWPQRKRHDTVIQDITLHPDKHGQVASDEGGVRGKDEGQQGDTTTATCILSQFVVDRTPFPEGTRRSWRFTHRHGWTSTLSSDHLIGGSRSWRARRPLPSVALRPITRLAQPAPVPGGDLVPSRASCHVTLLYGCSGR
jgi:hypothetical protein